jgi:hypothetical protein
MSVNRAPQILARYARDGSRALQITFGAWKKLSICYEGLLAKTCASNIGIHLYSHRDWPLAIWHFCQIRQHRVYHRSGGVGGRVGCTLDFKLSQCPKSISGKTATFDIYGSRPNLVFTLE